MNCANIQISIKKNDCLLICSLIETPADRILSILHNVRTNHCNHSKNIYLISIKLSLILHILQIYSTNKKRENVKHHIIALHHNLLNSQ